MNAGKLRRIIDSDLHLSLNVTGIFAVDTLPDTPLKPGRGVIANVDLWGGTGLHWIVLYRSPGGGCEFFDSFGRKPQHYDERFKSFLSLDSKDVLYNRMPLQDSDSDECGAFCIYYLYHRCRGHKMNDILSHFSTNRLLNDVIVNAFVDKMIIKSM
jgi:hypothetical protein